jgi:alpha-galactosidase
LGKQGVRWAKYGDLEMWVRPLADGGHAVGLFNRGETAAKATATFSDIGIEGAHAVRDLWEHADKGTVADSYTAEVPPHGVVLIKIAK